MCGINGILRTDPSAPPVDVQEALRTRERMATRGPDGAGLWSDKRGDVVLAHRRLSIIDLTDAGRQPMSCADGRYWIVFNGEIYNYRQLRAELASGYPFRSKTDTEVILAAYARLGPAALGRFRGMFALAIWDESEKRLLLARDPNGIKPLYYSATGQYVRFASQVKALVAGGAIPTRVDPAGLCGFLQWGAVPEPWTIYDAVKSLPPGHFVWATDKGLSAPERWPRAPEIPVNSVDLATAVEDSVAAHLVSDVPVAVFLSSGLDSSLVTTLASKHLSNSPIAITLRFREFLGNSEDEGPLASELARVLGVRHVERWVTRDEFLAGWNDAIQAMDQPSIDGFNTYWVCRVAREAGVKVALSGLGGDELLGGYPSFRQVPRLASWLRAARRMPGSASLWPAVARLWSVRKPKLSGLVRYGDTVGGAYFLRRALFLPEDLPALLGGEQAAAGLRECHPLATVNTVLGDSECVDDWELVQALETRLYLRNQLLRDSDWASMAHSLELRVPFVDDRLQVAARRIDPALRRQGKAYLIHTIVGNRLPAALFSRPKTGFLTPIAGWLAGEAPTSRTGFDSRRLAMRILEEWQIPCTKPPESGPPSSRPMTSPSAINLVVAPGLLRETGGIQTYNRNLLEALRQAETSTQALVLNDTDADLAPIHHGGTNVRGFGRRKAALAATALRLIGTARPQVVWLTHRNFLRLSPFLRRKGPRVHLLVYGIDAWPPLSASERWALGSVDRVFAISPYTADCFRRAGFAGEVELLPCSLPHDWALPEVTEAPWGQPHRLLAVSRLATPDRYKGIDHTLEALALLRKQSCEVSLDVVGEGPDEGRLRRLAGKANVADAVHFHGRVTDARLRELYSACDLFVLPSGAEGFGIVYLEALAHARAVVAADAGGAPFAVRHGDTGWLVPHGDVVALARCIRERLEDREGTRRSAMRGRQMVENEFSFGAFARRVRILSPRSAGTLVRVH